MIAVGITMLVLLLSGCVARAPIIVNANGGGDYTSIQNAVNAANPGDTILVNNGAYYENVNVTKQLTLRGIGMPVVDARGNGSAITLSADGIIFEGFTATGAGSFSNVGIKVTSSSNTLIGNNASNNWLGIYVVGGSLDSSNNNNTLSGNKASNNDYGISLGQFSSNNTLSGNNASNNIYGISLGWYSNYNTLIGNVARSNSQVGIYLDGSSNNKIYNNIFNNTNNYEIHASSPNINTWNTTKQSSPNIIGGSNLGGNFWANPGGTGFSQTCMDSNSDGICDSAYEVWPNNIYNLNIDYLPLASNP
jgi:parallel beta-helix repeat protein